MIHMLPTEAWAYIQSDPSAVFLDVRMEIESQVPDIPNPAMLVRVPDSANWMAVKDPV